jgi:hypothetical protein
VVAAALNFDRVQRPRIGIDDEPDEPLHMERAAMEQSASFRCLHLHSLHYQPQRQRQLAQQAGQQDPWDEQVRQRGRVP